MNRLRKIAYCICAGFLLTQFSGSIAVADESDNPLKAGNRYVQTQILSDRSVFQPGDSDEVPVARVGVRFNIEPGWHIYWQNSGEAAIPTKVKWLLPEGWRASELRWPAPTRFLEKGNITTFGYDREVVLISDLYSSSVIPSGDEPIRIAAQAKWLVCKDICVPGERTSHAEFIFSASKPEGASKDFAVIDAFDRLTPKDPSYLNKMPGYEKFELTTRLLSVSGAQKGDFLAEIGLSNTNCEAAPDVSQHLQLFHYSSPTLKVGAPFANSTVTGSLCRHSILLPVSTGAATPMQEIRGVVVLSPSLTASPAEVALDWKLDPKEPVEISALPTGNKLAYRVVSHAPAAVVPALVTDPNVVSVTFIFALLSAFAAGLILNLMPCVLPIISIKVMSFVGQADKPRREVIGSALAYAAGILSTFLVLALILIVLKPIGYQIGWGFQFQQPPLVLAVTVIVFVLSLAFFDIFHVQLPGMQEANRAVSKVSSPFAKHFFDGVLATALSTPCSAPFLGTALTFAFAQPAVISLTIFISIGMGLALPYVILALNPRFVRFLPKPGNWMFHFRQLLGFLLLGTVVWLLFVIDNLTEEGVVWAVGLLLLIYFCFWAQSWAKEARISSSKLVVMQLSLIVTLCGAVQSFWPELTSRKGAVEVKGSELIDWQSYSAEALARAKSSKMPIFIDFTAQWCITCKANEKLVIETKKVADALREYHVSAFKADWTTGSEEITLALKSYGGFGVPYYVILSAKDGTPTVLPTLLTPETLVSAFREAAK